MPQRKHTSGLSVRVTSHEQRSGGQKSNRPVGFAVAADDRAVLRLVVVELERAERGAAWSHEGERWHSRKVGGPGTLVAPRA
jgi:hypothetical protein